MATMRKRTETERGHKYEHTELVPMEWKNGQATRYEVIHNEEEDRPPAVWDDAPIVSPLRNQIARSTSHIEGSWSDRARAFNISTLNLSIVTGIMFAIAAIVFGASLSFFALALYFFAGFAVAWLIAYLMHTFISAEGAQMADTLLLWRFLFNEQRHRHNRYSTPKTDGQKALETVLLAAAVGVTVLAGLGLLVAVFVESAPR